MNTRQPLFLISVTVCCFGMPLCVCAQKTVAQSADFTSGPTASTEAKLALSVRLSLGEVSVEAFTQALSRQTGLTITASAPLRERTLIVRMENIRASAALDAIAELHDWTWREAEPGQILLARRILKVPQQPEYMPRLIQNALPADLRAYLHIPRPTDKLHEAPKAVSNVKAKNVGEWLEQTAVQQRLDTIPLQVMRDFRTTVSVDALVKNNLPYAKLTDEQKKLLLSCYIYDGITSLDSIIRGSLPLMCQDPGGCVIHFDEKSSNFQGTGFGAYIEPLKGK